MGGALLAPPRSPTLRGMVHVLEREQFIPAPLREVWAFFSDPKNLNEITPEDLHFTFIRGHETPMYPGQLIEYRITLLPGLRVPWLTQITHVVPLEMFIDEQRLGPYRLWIHEHRFQEVEGGVLMRDRVVYALPLWPLGELVHRLYVRPRLEAIFRYRQAKVAERFGAVPKAGPSAP